MKRIPTITGALMLAVGSHAGGPRPCDAQSTPVARTDGEVVTLIGGVPPGGLFTDSRGALYLRCVPDVGEPELAQALEIAFCACGWRKDGGRPNWSRRTTGRGRWWRAG